LSGASLPRSLPHLLGEQAAAFGDRECLRLEGRRLTFAQLEEASARLAGALAGLGVRRGDRVALMLPNGFEFPTAWLALARLGAVTVPLNVQSPAADLRHVLSDSGARLALAGRAEAKVLRQAAPACPALGAVAVYGPEPAPAGALDLAELARDAAPAAIAPVRPDDLLSIQYTSGTTGFPKGCMLTHRFYLELAGAARDYGRFTRGDVVLTAQPFYYMDPPWNLVLCLLVGMSLVVLPRFSASTFWSTVKEHRATFFYCLGTMPLYLLKQPEDPDVERGHRVRLVLCSGIVPQLHAEFERRWGCPWREVYGSTELGAVLRVPLEDAASVGSGAMGAPFPDREVRVVDADGRAVPRGEAGELLVRGGTTMLGYWGNPEATARWRDADGWARTGDLVFADERGFYHLVGRLKDMIRRGGENIAAAEVEAVLCQHPGVLAAACVPVPDPLRGEEVKAYVQLRPGETPKTVPPEALVTFARERLARFKVPRFVQYVDRFPMTPSERIAKQELLKRGVDLRAGAWDAETGGWG
jgi:crotonobetaine/carnitine-CoA ligase